MRHDANGIGSQWPAEKKYVCYSALSDSNSSSNLGELEITTSFPGDHTPYC
jgi:hypothetical protein